MRQHNNNNNNNKMLIYYSPPKRESSKESAALGKFTSQDGAGGDTTNVYILSHCHEHKFLIGGHTHTTFCAMTRLLVVIRWK